MLRGAAQRISLSRLTPAARVEMQRLMLLAPALAVGLFASRLLCELWLPGPAGTIILTIAAVVISVVIMLRLRPARSWPLLVLGVYVFFPEPLPRLAASMAALAGIAAILASRRARAPAERVIPSALPALLLGTGFFVLYVITLSPGVLPADSGELQLVAARLGVAHPPGFPLYTMVAHLMTRLPIGSPAYNVNLLSAIISAATLTLLYLTVLRTSDSHFGAAVAVVALGTATTFWAEATTANIRALTAFFAALALYGLIRLWDEQPDAAETRPLEVSRWFNLTVLALSFGVAHHPSLIFVALIFGLFVLWVKPSILWSPRHWLAALLAGLAALVPLLYRPWRAMAGARGAGALDTLDGFIEHVLALGFRGDFFYFLESSLLWQRLLVMGNVLAFQFSPWLLLGMAAGFMLLLRRLPRLAFLLGGSLALHTLISAIYRAPQTVEYMMPAYIPAAILLGYAVGRLAVREAVADKAGQRRWSEPAPQLGKLLATGLFVAAVLQGLDRYPSFRALHQQQTTREYAGALLAEAPPGSLVLAGWHWVTSLWYLQEVEGQRPDLEIHYVFPTNEPYFQTWLRLTEDALAIGKTVVTTHYDEAAFQSLPPPEPLGDAFLFRRTTIPALPVDYQPLELRLGDKLRIAGYRLQSDEAAVGEALAIDIAWQPLVEPLPLSLFVHLVGSDGLLYGQGDVVLRARPDGLTLTRLWITPRPGSQPGSYNLMIGAYGEQPLLNAAGEARTSLVQITVRTSPWKPFTARSTWRPAPEGNRQLIGYDWDNTLPDQHRLYLHWQKDEGYVTEVMDGVAPPVLPGPWGIETALALDSEGHYVPFGGGIVWDGPGLDASFTPGEQLRLPQILRSSHPQDRDLVVSVRLIGFAEDGFHWAWSDLDDGIPAMGAIPSLKWVAGSTVWDPHQFTVDASATPGQSAGAVLRLYDAFTGRPIPVLDERIIALPLPFLPLGRTKIVAP